MVDQAIEVYKELRPHFQIISNFKSYAQTITKNYKNKNQSKNFFALVQLFIFVL